MTFEAFIDLLEAPRRTARGIIAKCPAHNDRRPSLSACKGDDGRTLVHCLAGCTVDEIVSALGLRMADLFPGKQTRESRARSRRVNRLKEKKAQFQNIDMGLQGVFREADAAIEAAKGDISEWTEQEIDLAMTALGDAYNARRIEEDERRTQEYFRS